MGCKWGRGSQGSCKGGFAHEDGGKTSSRGHVAEPPWQDGGAGTPKMPPGDAVLGAGTAPTQLPFLMCLGPSTPARGWMLPPCPALRAQTLPSHQGRGTSRWGTATEATQGPRGWGGCWARCPGVTGGWQCGTGTNRAWDTPPLPSFPKHPSLEMLQHRHLCLGVQAGAPKTGLPSPMQQQWPHSSPGHSLRVRGPGTSPGPPHPASLCPPPRPSPPPWLKLLKRLQPPAGDLILLLFASAPPRGPGQIPPKKPSPAPGDCDHHGAGGEGARSHHRWHWEAGGEPAPFGFLPPSPNVIVAPRNSGSVRPSVCSWRPRSC